MHFLLVGQKPDYFFYNNQRVMFCRKIFFFFLFGTLSTEKMSKNKKSPWGNFLLVGQNPKFFFAKYSAYYETWENIQKKFFPTRFI